VERGVEAGAEGRSDVYGTSTSRGHQQIEALNEKYRKDCGWGTEDPDDYGTERNLGTFGGTYANAPKEVSALRSRGFTSRSEADDQERYDALQREAGGSAGAHPGGVRAEDTKGEGAGSTGELFGDTSLDPEELAPPAPMRISAPV
jgi:hypothetical protein